MCCGGQWTALATFFNIHANKANGIECSGGATDPLMFGSSYGAMELGLRIRSIVSWPGCTESAAPMAVLLAVLLRFACDLHVRTATDLHQSFLWLRPAQA